MSPKFALALLLLCFVLLGLSDAQGQQRQSGYRVRGRYAGRNLGGSPDAGGGFGATDGGAPPPLDGGGVDCNQNNLAGGGRDRFSRRH